MPHQRHRAAFELIAKRMKLWPVIGVVGARQTGKSTLLRDLIAPTIKAEYATLDSKTDRGRAENSPESFSEPRSASTTLILDEIQKVPDLFDALKLHVDRKRRPGMYIISGSTEFSRFTGIRESLTGRIGTLNLYPMTLQEIHRKPLGAYFLKHTLTTAALSLTQFDKRLEMGGMPGLCFLRDTAEFKNACELWLETTCFRDLQQIKGRGFDGELALALIGEVARAAEPTAASVARALRKDTRLIQRYLDAFCMIFVLKRLSPHPAGVGKPHYLLCDPGIAAHLEAPRYTQIRTHLLLEAAATCEYAGFGRAILQYYRNEKTSRVPVVLSWPKAKGSPRTIAIQFHDGESPSRGDLASLQAFQDRAREPMRLMLLTQTGKSYRDGKIEVFPLRG